MTVWRGDVASKDFLQCWLMLPLLEWCSETGKQGTDSELAGVCSPGRRKLNYLVLAKLY